MKKQELKQIIKEEIQKQKHFLKNPITQQLNKLIFNLYDSGKIDEKDYENIQNFLIKIDNKL
jgi:hypothetical protein